VSFPKIMFCVRAASGHATAALPSSVMNSATDHSDHLVGAREQRRRYGEAEHPGAPHMSPLNAGYAAEPGKGQGRRSYPHCGELRL